MIKTLEGRIEALEAALVAQQRQQWVITVVGVSADGTHPEITAYRDNSTGDTLEREPGESAEAFRARMQEWVAQLRRQIVVLETVSKQPDLQASTGDPVG